MCRVWWRGEMCIGGRATYGDAGEQAPEGRILGSMAGLYIYINTGG